MDGNLKERLPTTKGKDELNQLSSNLNEMLDYFSRSDNIKTPKAIIANTIKGKGFSFSENDNSWHHGILTKSLYEKALSEINSESKEC